MKTAVVTKPGVIEILEVPVPEISDDEVLVEVKYCGICGSDVHTFLPGSMPPPIYIGHEFSGVLAEVGKNVEGWQVGDRVAVNPGYACGTCYACRHGQPGACEIGSINTLGCVTGQEHAGAFANYVRVSLPRYRLNRLPDEVSFEAGALAEPLSVALHGVLLSQVQMGETVMVMGAGGVGLGAAAFLRHLGAGTVIVTETIAARAALAKKLGADYVFNPATDNNIDNEVLDLTHGRGVDLIIEASGSPAAFESATYYLGRGGRITQISVVVGELCITPLDWLVHEWQLRYSCAYSDDEFAKVVNFLGKTDLPITDMVTSKIKLSEVVARGMDAIKKPGNQEVKILVEPD